MINRPTPLSKRADPQILIMLDSNQMPTKIE